MRVRSFFRTHRLRQKSENIQRHQSSSSLLVSPPSLSQLPILKQENIPVQTLPSNDQQYAANISCCGADEKKDLIKNQVKAAQMVKDASSPMKTIDDAMDPTDHRILKVAQQQQKQTPKVEIDEDLKDLFGKKEITKAMINQLAQRAMAGSMNASNDDPPMICTKKHCSFANEPLTIKPVTCIPGIGPVHGQLCEKQGIVMAHQLLSRYIMSPNDEIFMKSLIDELGFTPKSATMTRDGLKEMRRHLI